MGKPRLIILIRHAQSEGNKNRDIHQTIPDHRVKLTPDGQKQALEAGRKLRGLLRPDDTLHFYTSPYRRTRETTEGMLQSLTSDDPDPSPFPRHTIKVFEEPRLREQDFGNFQPSSAEMTRMWHERAEYGHFFYRIPNGESAADAYDRVSGFNETLWRSFKEDDFASVCVLVTHGLMTRVFLMKWYHWSVEYFEDLRNMNHCEFVVMQRNEGNGKYMLRNSLRTWTDWRREQAEEKKEKRRATVESPVAIPVRTKWGAVSDHDPSGFDARKRERQNTAELFQEDNSINSSISRNDLQQLAESLEQQQKRHNNQKPSGKTTNQDQNTHSQDREVSPYTTTATRDKEIDDTGITSPHSRRIQILQSGRDGGGTHSGRASRAGSESEDASNGATLAAGAAASASTNSTKTNPPKAEHLTEAERRKQFRPPSSMRMALAGAFAADGSTRSRNVAMADALGDQSDMDEDEDEDGDDSAGGDDDANEDAKKQRAEEQTFGASVR